MKKKSPPNKSHGPREDLPLAKRIEHTLLKVDATSEDVERLCREALEMGFRSVCVLQRDVELCRRILDDSGILVVTVVNFPLAGAMEKSVARECGEAIILGADEVDFVVDVRSLIEGDLTKVRRHAESVVKAASSKPTKAILETAFLNPEQLAQGLAAIEDAGVDFAKTSTGFGPRGASIEDVKLMRSVCGNRMGIKASGGIKEREWAEKLVEAGADLIGTSSGMDCI